MGTFDPETSFAMPSTPEVEPVETATPSNDGHAEETVEEAQAPEVTEEVETTETEPKATQEDETIQPEQEKLLANKYKSLGDLVNGIKEAATYLGENPDFSNAKSAEEMEAIYLDYRRRISSGEVKNFAPEGDKVQAEVQQDDLTTRLDEIIQTQTQLLENPGESILDLDEYEMAAKFSDNPKQALTELTTAFDAKVEARINLEGAKLLKMIAPQLNTVGQINRITAANKSWEEAEVNVRKLTQHMDINVDEYRADVGKYFDTHPDVMAIIEANPNEKGIRERYIMLAIEEARVNRKMAALAETTSKADTKVINDSKQGLKMKGSTGGAAAVNGPSQQDELSKAFGNHSESGGVFG